MVLILEKSQKQNSYPIIIDGLQSLDVLVGGVALRHGPRVGEHRLEIWK